MTIKVMTVFGTRPEAIKMAPVVLGLEQDPDFESVVCVTAQHREMLDQVLDIFGIDPSYDLDLMKPMQTLYDVTKDALCGVGEIIRSARPDVVLVHGDTTTCFAASLAAFYEGVPVGHVEAGLRTGNLRAPFPEEGNRALVGRLTSFHFAPTKVAVENLKKENINSEDILETGNTVIDALHIAKEKVDELPEAIWIKNFGSDVFDRVTDSNRKLILITGHRRENFGSGFVDLCNAIKKLAESHKDWDFIYPVHLNPNVQKPVYEILGGLTNVKLIDPLSYLSFVWLMAKSDLILTDSGGVQEEGPSLGKPVLVMRDVTERPEAVKVGTVRLVGTKTDAIVEGVETVLCNALVYEKMSTAINPYGDGLATQRILDYLRLAL